jgi:hypothetical protein
VQFAGSQACAVRGFLSGVAVLHEDTSLPTHIVSCGGHLELHAALCLAQPLNLPLGCLYHILKVQR